MKGYTLRFSPLFKETDVIRETVKMHYWHFHNHTWYVLLHCPPRKGEERSYSRCWHLSVLLARFPFVLHLPSRKQTDLHEELGEHSMLLWKAMHQLQAYWKQNIHSIQGLVISDSAPPPCRFHHRCSTDGSFLARYNKNGSSLFSFWLEFVFSPWAWQRRNTSMLTSHSWVSIQSIRRNRLVSWWQKEVTCTFHATSFQADICCRSFHALALDHQANRWIPSPLTEEHFSPYGLSGAIESILHNLSSPSLRVHFTPGQGEATRVKHRAQEFNSATLQHRIPPLLKAR